MTTTALVFMLLAMVLVWGGLVVSILRLRRDGNDAGWDEHGDPVDGHPGVGRE
ncbi:methionine/alanine import family NSS transporter small subunit [Actinotalea sp. K2]|uniref:methionine/alanine import family NSS transporter small subunit n=1 Tax=Actinotalea sp. K2 TaxID=2939438 RepID=UPI002017D3C3|nr:methionine/alanine import family NSS transporter small subunit [Actinotalea sp. K2]MCL3860951.1 methionine/alanine import family NSS transporter small subunit [Actinotalea sp. K2]